MSTIYTCRSYRVNSRLLNLTSGVIGSFRNNRRRTISWRSASVLTFKNSKSQTANIAFSIFSFPGLRFGKAKQANKVISFSTKAAFRLNLIPYLSPQIKQDKEFWIIDKLRLSEFGLIPTADNSLGEIISSLILSWSDGRLDSTQMKIAFYKHSILGEDNQFFTIQSFIVDCMNNTLKFP